MTSLTGGTENDYKHRAPLYSADTEFCYYLQSSCLSLAMVRRGRMHDLAESVSVWNSCLTYRVKSVLFYVSLIHLEAGIAQWLERQTRHRNWVACSVESQQERWENFLLQSQLQFCADSYFAGIHSTLVFLQFVKRSLSFLPKVQVPGRLQLNTHAPYVCSFA